MRPRLTAVQREQRPQPSSSRRQLPHDLDAEGDVLGHIFEHPEDLPIVRSVMEFEHFYLEINRMVGEAIWALDDLDAKSGDREAVVTAQRVVAWFKDRRWMGKAESILRRDFDASPTASLYRQAPLAAYLFELVSARPSIQHVGPVAARVATTAQLRTMITVLQTRAAEAFGDIGTSAEAWCEVVAAEVHQVAAASAKQTSSTAREAAEKAAAALAAAEGDTGAITGYSTGVRCHRGCSQDGSICCLDKATAGIHPGTCTLVTADKTGGGKSALVGAITLHLALSSLPEASRPAGPGWTFAELAEGEQPAALVFTNEMTQAEYALRWACQLSRVDNEDIRHGKLDAEKRGRLMGALAQLAELPIRIDDRGFYNAQSFHSIRAEVLKSRAQLAREGKTLRLVVIDLLQNLDWRPHVDKGGNQYNGLLEIGTLMKHLAAQLDVAVLAAAHENDKGHILACPKLGGDAQGRWRVKIGKHAEPPATDLGSDRPVPQSVTIEILKQRGGRAGIKVPAWYHGGIYTFTSAEEQWL